VTDYFIPPHRLELIKSTTRGACAGGIPSNCEILDININGYVRNLSDWLAIFDMHVETFASRCRPGLPVARALGLQPVQGQYLDNTWKYQIGRAHV